MTGESLPRLLLRLVEAGRPAILWGRQARPHFGRDFDRLLARRLLVEEPQATEWPVCGSCDCGLDARPIQDINARLVAPCPLDHRADAVLLPDDLRSFRIEAEGLVGEIAEASGFVTPPAEVLPDIWSLGPTVSGRAVFLALSRADEYSPACFLLLRSIARSAPITILTPDLPAAVAVRFDAAGVYRVCGFRGIGTAGHLERRGVEDTGRACRPSMRHGGERRCICGRRP